MKLACIVLAHRAPQQVATLLSALKHAQVQPYLHVDRRVSIAPFTHALADAGLSRVVLLPRHKTSWAGPGLLDASLDGIARGVSERCTYFTLISGQDFPLKPIDEIVSFFEGAHSRSYLEHFELPVEEWRFGGRDRVEFYSYDVFGRRETCIPRGEDVSFLNWKGRLINETLRLRSAFKPPRRPPPYVRNVAGRQWWNLSLEAAEYILRFVEEHPDYRGYHEHSLSPDEIFFQSMLVGTSFVDSHEIVNDSLRFTRWRPGSSHPEMLTRRDLPALLASGKLFARKFDSDTHGAVLRDLQAAVNV